MTGDVALKRLRERLAGDAEGLALVDELETALIRLATDLAIVAGNARIQGIELGLLTTPSPDRPDPPPLRLIA